MNTKPISIDDDLIAINDVPAILPRATGAKPLDRTTLHRWVRKGVSGVVLESIMVGSATFTTREALDRFFEAVKRARTATKPRVELPTLGAKRADAELARLGV